MKLRLILSDVVRTKAFAFSLLIAVASGSISVGFFWLDEDMGGRFATDWMPDSTVFTLFASFASLVVAFRTSNALNRYTDGARHLHKMGSQWFDVGCSLASFCRIAEAPAQDVEQFVQVLVRLISLLNALCLENLQKGHYSETFSSTGGFRFNLLGSHDLDQDTQCQVANARDKPECVFQLLQVLVIEAQKSRVLSVPPPILSRSYQQMSCGLTTYYEAKKLAFTPLPIAYKAITWALMLCAAAYMPVKMALLSKGPITAFSLSFSGTFLLWFMNSVAEVLDNPFRKDARSLDAASSQDQLNCLLRQLVETVNCTTPTVDFAALDEKCTKVSSLGAWRSQVVSSSRHMSLRMSDQSAFSSRNSMSFGRMAGLDSITIASRSTATTSMGLDSITIAGSSTEARTPGLDSIPVAATRTAEACHSMAVAATKTTTDAAGDNPVSDDAGGVDDGCAISHGAPLEVLEERPAEEGEGRDVDRAVFLRRSSLRNVDVQQASLDALPARQRRCVILGDTPSALLHGCAAMDSAPSGGGSPLPKQRAAAAEQPPTALSPPSAPPAPQQHVAARRSIIRVRDRAFEGVVAGSDGGLGGSAEEATIAVCHV